MSKSVSEKAQEVADKMADENAIPNPSQIILGPIFGPMYLAAAPVAIYLTKPGGTVQSVLETALRLFPGGPVPTDRIIPALSSIFVLWTFGVSGAFSVAGQGMGRKEGYDNDHPRAHVNNLPGLPLRLRSAHYQLMENFGSFAIAAALAQAVNPRDQQSINLLALHLFLKLLVHYPSYLANIAAPRSLSHILATGSTVAVCWRLAVGA